jgi:YbgC/YbaW family acyl-CoA thioester hydrolase
MQTTFPFSVDVTVRGYEVDVFGHVNNAVYLNWLEHARWSMVGANSVLAAAPEVQAVLRHVELDYQRETRLGDSLRVTLWGRKVGTTSFTLGSSIEIRASADPARSGKIALLATQVITCVQRGAGKIPVPEAWRRQFPVQDPGPQPPSTL